MIKVFLVYAIIALQIFLMEMYFSEKWTAMYSWLFLLLWPNTWQNHLKQWAFIPGYGLKVQSIRDRKPHTSSVSWLAGYIVICGSEVETEKCCCFTCFLHFSQSRTSPIECCHLPKSSPSVNILIDTPGDMFPYDSMPCHTDKEDESLHAIPPN